MYWSVVYEGHSNSMAWQHQDTVSVRNVTEDWCLYVAVAILFAFKFIQVYNVYPIEIYICTEKLFLLKSKVLYTCFWFYVY
jgi:hypothetical protein